MKLEKPKEFAELYMKYLEGGVKLPLPICSPTANYSWAYSIFVKDTSLSKQNRESYINVLKNRLKKHTKEHSLPVLNKLKLTPTIEGRIYMALFDFGYLIQFSNSKSLFQELNKKHVKQRKDSIKYLEKALKYIFLTKENRQAIKEEIDYLRMFDRKPITYHPLMDIDFIKTYMINSDPLHLDEDNFQDNRITKLLTMLVTPLKKKEGRPRKYFLKSLQVVIFKLLNNEAKRPVEQAKSLTSDIIKEYFRKQSHLRLSNLKPKSVDNALHST